MANLIFKMWHRPRIRKISYLEFVIHTDDVSGVRGMYV